MSPTRSFSESSWLVEADGPSSWMRGSNFSGRHSSLNGYTGQAHFAPASLPLLNRLGLCTLYVRLKSIVKLEQVRRQRFMKPRCMTAPAAVCLFGVVALASCKSAKKTESEKRAALRPLNVVVVTIDTLRPDHVYCYGYRDVETPTLDSLAQRGVVFEQAVAQTPLTPPSHASIFTGQYPTAHHDRNTGGFILPSSSRPLAKILQEQGWDTAAFIGSAVLKKIFGFNLGFAVYDDQMPKPGPADEFREDPERRAGVVVDRAIKWLNAQSGKPFFLWVHLYDPHLPYNPPSPFQEQYKDHPYDGEIAYTDQQLGHLIDAVRKKATQGTIIAVLSDHGESLGEHGEYTHGVFLYDSTLRIVFLMSGPGIPAEIGRAHV